MVKSKKGVESVIAVVLILMITIASASSFFYWYSRVQKSAQGRTEQSTTTFLNQLVSCVKLPYVNYNLLTNESEVQVKNCGTTSVTIGDGDDNVLITSEQCAFGIDSTNCDVCPLTIGPGALGKFMIYFNNIACSGGANASDIMASQGNLQHTITFSIDRTAATASKDFVPENILSCSLDVDGPTTATFIGIPGEAVCVNYSKTLNSNIAQTITIGSSIQPSPPPIVCTVTYYEGNGCEGAAITEETMSAGTANFSANITMYVMPVCNVTTTIKSTDLATCTDSITTYAQA